jgi:hypothetical protein
MVFLHSLTGISQLKFAFGVWLFTDLAEDNVGEWSFGTDDYLRPEIAYRFDDIAVDEKRPQFSNVHEIEGRLLQLD